MKAARVVAVAVVVAVATVLGIGSLMGKVGIGARWIRMVPVPVPMAKILLLPRLRPTPPVPVFKCWLSLTSTTSMATGSDGAPCSSVILLSSFVASLS